MIPGEKLILHGRRSISASCKALELECRDKDFFKKEKIFFGASKTLAKTLIPGTWRDPHESGLWPLAQILVVNPCTGEAKGHVAAGLSNHGRQRVCGLRLRV